MPRITLGLGVLLIVLGVAGYIATGREHATALIPAIIGGVFALLAALAMWKPESRKHVMHAAVGLALLVFIGMIPGIFSLLSLIVGGDVDNPPAAVSRGVLGLLCLAYVGLGVRSFIVARRQRENET
ncbi:hypothetical protein ACERK3_13160 [Phycisphaerales bacterium AB-hyl4]|uniref:Uncharacterized protein n=1 Tax=Natronomicrosphaera hydrolytica TaxID=3242702 RepID=A0ABV4U6M1_9BACT